MPFTRKAARVLAVDMLFREVRDRLLIDDLQFHDSPCGSAETPESAYGCDTAGLDLWPLCAALRRSSWASCRNTRAHSVVREGCSLLFQFQVFLLIQKCLN